MIFEIQKADGTVEEIEIEGAEDMDLDTLSNLVIPLLQQEEEQPEERKFEDVLASLDTDMEGQEFEPLRDIEELANMTRDEFTSYIAPFIRAEGDGKYTNDPNDSGGPTKFGITLKTLQQWRKDDSLTEVDVEKMERREAEDIYYNMFYTGPKLQRIDNKRIRDMVLDHGMTSGAWGIKLLQRLVGVEDDGKIGPKTSEATEEFIKKHGEKMLLDRYAEARSRYYTNLANQRPKDKSFLRGWLNRVKETRLRVDSIPSYDNKQQTFEG